MLQMPIMDGNAAARELRELVKKGEIERIPILGLSAHVRQEQKDAMKEAGMDDAISKPYKIEELEAKIASVTNKK